MLCIVPLIRVFVFLLLLFFSLLPSNAIINCICWFVLMVAICANATTNWAPTVFNLMSNAPHDIRHMATELGATECKKSNKTKIYEQMQMLINRINFNCFGDSWDENAAGLWLKLVNRFASNSAFEPKYFQLFSFLFEKEKKNGECEEISKRKDGNLMEGHHLCWWWALMIVSYNMQFPTLKWLAQISKIHWPVDPFKDIEFIVIVFSNFEWCEYSVDEHFVKTSERSNRKTMFNAHFSWRSVQGLCRLPSMKLTFLFKMNEIFSYLVCKANIQAFFFFDVSPNVFFFVDWITFHRK